MTRVGPTSYARNVLVTVTGSATNTSDYAVTGADVQPGGSSTPFIVRIPAGQTSSTLTVTPSTDAEIEGPESVTFTVEGTSATAIIDEGLGP